MQSEPTRLLAELSRRPSPAPHAIRPPTPRNLARLGDKLAGGVDVTLTALWHVFSLHLKAFPKCHCKVRSSSSPIAQRRTSSKHYVAPARRRSWKLNGPTPSRRLRTSKPRPLCWRSPVATR